MNRKDLQQSDIVISKNRPYGKLITRIEIRYYDSYCHNRTVDGKLKTIFYNEIERVATPEEEFMFRMNE